MGTRLALRIDALAAVLNETSGRAEAAVGLDGKTFNAAAVVIGHEDIFALAIQRQMAGARPAGSLLVQEGEFARRGLDGKGADRSGGLALETVHFIDGIEKAMIRGDLDEGWIGRLGDQAEGGD